MSNIDASSTAKTSVSSASTEKDKIKKKKKSKKKEKRGGIRAFISGVRSEFKRISWTGKEETAKWSIVVVVALVFFILFTLIADNGIITPVLVWLSSLFNG